MVAHLLSPHEALYSHANHRTQTTARAAGLALAAAGHAALILYLIGQTFRPPSLVEPPVSATPMIWQTLDLTPAQPMTNSPSSPPTDVHSTGSPNGQHVETLPVRVANATSTGPIAMNPFINLSGDGELSLGTPSIPHILTNPDWISRPTSEQVAKSYPEEALRLGLSGAVILSCQVTASGGVIGCKVNSESPAERGFGRAALGVAPFFRIKPGTYDGEAADGAVVLIPVRFQISG